MYFVHLSLHQLIFGLMHFWGLDLRSWSKKPFLTFISPDMCISLKCVDTFKKTSLSFTLKPKLQSKKTRVKCIYVSGKEDFRKHRPCRSASTLNTELSVGQNSINPMHAGFPACGSWRGNQQRSHELNVSLGQSQKPVSIRYFKNELRLKLK